MPMPDGFKRIAMPWFVRHTDDDHHMNMTVVSSKDYGKCHDGRVFDGEPDTVAITFHQLHPPVGCAGVDDNIAEADLGDTASQLIARAPDHALLLAATFAGLLWVSAYAIDRDTGQVGRFAVVQNGALSKLYDVTLDHFGCPIISDDCRNAIIAALQAQP